MDRFVVHEAFWNTLRRVSDRELVRQKRPSLRLGEEEFKAAVTTHVGPTALKMLAGRDRLEEMDPVFEFGLLRMYDTDVNGVRVDFVHRTLMEFVAAYSCAASRAFEHVKVTHRF